MIVEIEVVAVLGDVTAADMVDVGDSVTEETAALMIEATIVVDGDSDKNALAVTMTNHKTSASNLMINFYFYRKLSPNFNESEF